MKHPKMGYVDKKPWKRPPSHGRLQNGCVSGFINMFDFRLGRSTRRLISDGRSSISEISCNGRVSAGHGASSGGTEESAMAMSEFSKTSVKELMEEDMLKERATMNLCQEGSSTQTALGVQPTLDLFDQAAEPKTWDKIISEAIEEQINKSECVLKNDIVGVLEALSAQAANETDRELVAAVKHLMGQKLSSIVHSKEEEENPGPCCCEDLMDGVRIFTANYGLFQELLQESKSKYRSESTKGNGYLKQNDVVHARSKSLESFFHEGSSHSSLAVLNVEPADSGTDATSSSISSPSAHICNKVKNEKTMVFSLSFNAMKRKLLHSMGKKETVISSDKLMVPNSCGGKRSLRENMGLGSAEVSHKLSKEITSSSGRRGEDDVKLQENITIGVENSSRSQRRGKCKIYVEAKKHISDMLVNADENSNPMTSQAPKSLRMMLSDHVDSSPNCTSPGGCDGARLSQNRISENWHSQEDQENHSSSMGQSVSMSREASINDANADFDKIKINEMDSSISCKDQNNFSQSTYQEDKVSEGADIGEASTTAIGFEIGFSQCSESSTCPKSDSCEEDGGCCSPMSSSAVSREMEDSDHGIDKLEQPSPVSVLQPLFMDDAASIVSEPARDVEPQLINFEEQSDQGAASYTPISLEDEESPFEYVEAVLLGSGMNWDDFHLKWLSSQPILDSSLFDEVEVFSKRASHDQRLLFDSANEALKSVCGLHFRWCTANMPSLPIPTCVDLVNEIWRQVEWHLFQQMRANNSLDQILQTDIATSGKWINSQQDVQAIGFEIQETVLYELIEDILQHHQSQ